jgi:hypothetical protein
MSGEFVSLQSCCVPDERHCVPDVCVLPDVCVPIGSIWGDQPTESG